MTNRTAKTLALVYRSFWRVAWPLVRWYVRQKDAKRLVDPLATRERFGYSHRPRSWDDASTWVLWIHGASVGECLSMLPIVEFALSSRCAVAATAPADRRVVVTTTTPAARQLLQRRFQEMESIGDRAVCAFAALDAPMSVTRFYKTWRPNVGLWVESELWPTLISEASRRHIPIGLLNARISPQSLRWWSLPVLHSLIREVVARFSLVLCQDVTNQSRYRQLGAVDPRVATNLKFATTWQPSDASLLAALKHHLHGRSVWLAVSTHENEELLLTSVHDRLRKASLMAEPLLTVIIPRHPERTPTIVQQLHHSYPSLQISLRSTDHLPSPDTDIFIADTLGETGLFFDAIETVVVGGSFVSRGGHNPIEPLRAGCTVLVGPHSFNFTEIISQLQHCGSPLTQVTTTEELSQWLCNQFQRTPHSNTRESKQALMKALSIKAMTTYETALVKWFATDKGQFHKLTKGNT